MTVGTSARRQVTRCHHQSELTIESYANFAKVNSRNLDVVLIVRKMGGPLTPIEDLFLYESGSAHNGILPVLRRSVEVDEDQEFFSLTRP